MLSMGGGRDYISRLPDSILLHILSFLPTVDAMRTECVPGFRDLWMCLPNLSFNHCEFHCCRELESDQMEFRQEFIDFVNSVLIRHNRPTLDRFSLSMEFCLVEIEPTLEGDNRISLRRVSNMIGPWIHFAIRKKVRILNLNFAGCQDDTECEEPESQYYILPSIVLRSRSLVELYLDRCCIKLFGGIQLKSLRILSLTRVGLSDQKVNQILSGCPLLEELSLEECLDLDRLKISGPTRLRKLDISIAYMEKLDITLSSIKFLQLSAHISEIICPDITHLDIDIQQEDVMISDLPSLIEATVFLNKCHFTWEEYPNLRSFLQKLSNATSFKPCAFCIGSFLVWELTNHPCPRFNWKHVTTALGFKKWIIPGISRFLRSSPFLESLVIYAFPFDAAPDETPKIMGADYFDAENCWGSVGGETFDCLKHHLRNITIQGEITKPYIVDLIKFLLGNTLVLEKMVISDKRPPERYRNKYYYQGRKMKNPIPPVSMVELSRLVYGFHRASMQAEVHLS